MKLSVLMTIYERETPVLDAVFGSLKPQPFDELVIVLDRAPGGIEAHCRECLKVAAWNPRVQRLLRPNVHPVEQFYLQGLSSQMRRVAGLLPNGIAVPPQGRLHNDASGKRRAPKTRPVETSPWKSPYSAGRNTRPIASDICSQRDCSASSRFRPVGVNL